MTARAHKPMTRSGLYRRVWAKPLAVLADELGLSGNALAKICDRLLVPYPTRGYWAKVAVGKAPARPALPVAPEMDLDRITVSSVPSLSRRTRTRLGPAARRTQLVEVAKCIIVQEGMNAATMKRIAAQAGMSETQVYNYFGSREKLFVELARNETAKLQAAQRSDIARYEDHFDRIVASTRSYLRQTDRRGGLLQMLMMIPDVRSVMRGDNRKRGSTNLHRHAQHLVDTYKIPWDVAVGGTAVLSRLCGRAGKLVADRRASLASIERLCLAIVLHGSRRMHAAQDSLRGTQGLKAA